MTSFGSPNDFFGVHPTPAKRSRSNALVAYKFDQKEGRAFWEQLWTRKIDEQHHEVCCIPFFVYGLSLGDKILAANNFFFLVVEKSGNATFWVCLGHDVQSRGKLVKEIKALGAEFEWSSESKTLLAINASSPEISWKLTDLLDALEATGAVEFEVGDG